ncbi:Metallo-dependent phosphatase-like protein [Gymnopilus junonius]|uniref:Metallo-dependent phosphatase-like protein n=1 Tax=Gymnopilus junonius TaxID=109634 RepID=A0A9P5TGB8_GYMJU|nr:Metallo-dependent phosphatase-like protein [Gymnopilus junonius]
MSGTTVGYGDVVLKSPREIVYLDYSPSALPPKPSEEWTRFVCVSDTHSHSFDVPDGDVLLHSGDLTNMGLVSDFEKTVDWLCGLPHKEKIIIAGNHDLTLHADWYDKEYDRWHEEKQDLGVIMQLLKGNRAKEAGIVYLESERYEFRVKENGKLWSVYGSPWSPEFFNWAFNYERHTGQDLVATFPKVDILLTHGPAYQILDRVEQGEEVGCEALRARLRELRPRIHLAGHIHEAHGSYIHTWDPSSNFEPPVVQNDDPAVTTGHVIQETNEDVERTVFVNAANWPMGSRTVRGGVRVKIFGGPGFQAVVVDLKD